MLYMQSCMHPFASPSATVNSLHYDSNRCISHALPLNDFILLPAANTPNLKLCAEGYLHSAIDDSYNASDCHAVVLK